MQFIDLPLVPPELSAELERETGGVIAKPACHLAIAASEVTGTAYHSVLD
jgi:hypothetical protein